MKILVIGGTRFFGIPMVMKLLDEGHEITIATRGMTPDPFGSAVRRIRLNIYDPNSVQTALSGKSYDVVIDKMGYGSSDVKSLLNTVECEKFIHMSTAGVYRLDHMDIKEEEFDGSTVPLKWCSRGDIPYDECKKQAEAVLCQRYRDLDWTCIRCPYVLGRTDYTGRLLVYVAGALCGIPLNIDNPDAQICFANAAETGEFCAFLVNKDHVGAVNVCSRGTVSLREILDYIKSRTGCDAEIRPGGFEAPYNGCLSNSLCTEKAETLMGGEGFMDVHKWITDLLDDYIDFVEENRRTIDMQALITGVNGFIGHHAAAYFMAGGGPSSDWGGKQYPHTQR